MKTMKTWLAKNEEQSPSWFIIDATGHRVGRIATHVANILRGKNKPQFTPHADAGDFVVVINTDKMELTGNKLNSKKYFTHTRFFGSLKEKTAGQMMNEDSTFVLSEAVRGMLPTNKMSRHTILKLNAYPGAAHPHATQKPQAYVIPAHKGLKGRA
jgi:large subunit ribosomal protein L13